MNELVGTLWRSKNCESRIVMVIDEVGQYVHIIAYNGALSYRIKNYTRSNLLYYFKQL